MLRSRKLNQRSHQFIDSSVDSSVDRVFLNGHRVLVTDVFWSYWFLAVERQEIFFKRVQCEERPWTDDEVLLKHRFTNAYRASDSCESVSFAKGYI